MSNENNIPMISTKRTIKGVDAKGRNRTILKLDKTGLANLVQAVNALAELDPEYAALEIRTEVRDGAHGQFESSFVLAREFTDSPNGQSGNGGAKTKFVPKGSYNKTAGTSQSAAAKTQMSRIKAEV